MTIEQTRNSTEYARDVRWISGGRIIISLHQGRSLATLTYCRPNMDINGTHNIQQISSIDAMIAALTDARSLMAEWDKDTGKPVVAAKEAAENE